MEGHKTKQKKPKRQQQPPPPFYTYLEGGGGNKIKNPSNILHKTPTSQKQDKKHSLLRNRQIYGQQWQSQ